MWDRLPVSGVCLPVAFENEISKGTLAILLDLEKNHFNPYGQRQLHDSDGILSGNPYRFIFREAFAKSP